MESTFHSWAGDAWADWQFMFGLLGIGVALIALAAVSAGDTLGLGRVWAKLPLARRGCWLR